MYRHLLPTAALLLAGCASTNSSSISPADAQGKWSDPNLLTCANNAAPICKVAGGRTSKRTSACRCTN